MVERSSSVRGRGTWFSPSAPQIQHLGVENRDQRTWQAEHSSRGSRSTHPSMIVPLNMAKQALIDRIDFLLNSVDLGVDPCDEIPGVLEVRQILGVLLGISAVEPAEEPH